MAGPIGTGSGVSLNITGKVHRRSSASDPPPLDTGLTNQHAVHEEEAARAVLPFSNSILLPAVRFRVQSPIPDTKLTSEEDLSREDSLPVDEAQARYLAIHPMVARREPTLDFLRTTKECPTPSLRSEEPCPSGGDGLSGEREVEPPLGPRRVGDEATQTNEPPVDDIDTASDSSEPMLLGQAITVQWHTSAKLPFPSTSHLRSAWNRVG